MVNETFRIRLEAKNPEKGHLRAYRIDAGQDLFGQWSIEVGCCRFQRHQVRCMNKTGGGAWERGNTDVGSVGLLYVSNGRVYQAVLRGGDSGCGLA